MRSLQGLVFGTAGHIDHGKTSLVRALTGIDTDRLKEEKQRGISIDLGFAQMDLPDGRTISFVDVPGHERFVRNMLAGAAGMEAVLLVVAANESVMPQTREHLEICRLLGIKHGLIVLTKCDLASSAQIESAKQQIRSLVANSFLATAPILEVSVVTRAGLAELKGTLARLAVSQTSRDSGAVLRMPIDRSFTMKGFGAVVTGTLLAGKIAVGDSVEIHPHHLTARVRALQTQHKAVEIAFAGQRVAVNLSGIEQSMLKRGDILLAPDVFTPVRLIDVELNWFNSDAPPAPRELFVLHLGTAEINAHITVLSASEAQKVARIRVFQDLIACPGDRFVIRRPSPAQTVGGGVILDCFPPLRLNKNKTRVRLQHLAKIAADLSGRVNFLVCESANGRSLPELIRMTGASRDQIRHAASQQGNRLLISADDVIVSPAWIEAKRSRILALLREFHTAHPNAAGAPLSVLRGDLSSGLVALLFQDFPDLRIQGDIAALASHRAHFSSEESFAMQSIENAFRSGGFQPPSAIEAFAGSGLDEKRSRVLLEVLIKNNRIVKLPGDLFFHADVITHLRDSLAKQKGRRFSVTEFKASTNISRKFAIPLLEYLDRQRITRRDGEMRVVL